MRFGKRTEAPDNYGQKPNPPRPQQMDIEEVTSHQPTNSFGAATSTDPLELGGPIPRSVGRTADLYSDIRALRLTMEKDVEKVKAREHELREHIINNLSKSDDTGASGLRYRAQIVMKDVPRAADWTKIHAYIQKTGRFDLLQKRLGEKAVMDMAEDGKQIPGVEIIKVPEVSITKI